MKETEATKTTEQTEKKSTDRQILRNTELSIIPRVKSSEKNRTLLCIN